MSWIDRFTFVMRSTITTLREKVEDPERMLQQLVCDMEEELHCVKRSVAAAIADELQLGQDVEAARKEADLWESRATAALQAGNEATARQALDQKLRAEERWETLENSYESQREQTEKLRTSFRDLEDKIRQARHRRTLLVARLARAESQRSINDVLCRAEGPSAFAEFSRLERRVERAEALSDAWDQLDGKDPAAEKLDAQFRKEEKKNKLEAELAALKERAGATS